MTWEEVMSYCATGKMPRVHYNGKLNHNNHKGQVTTIKNNGKHRGVGVMFDGLEYEMWFHDSEDTDKRTRYMRDLAVL